MKPPAILNPLLESLRARIPEREVALLPGDAFFVRTVPLPEPMSGPDLESFAALQLEALSPFPLEHMAWGWYCPPGALSVLLYAAPKARLRRCATPTWETAYQAFPGFLSRIGTAPGPSMVILIVQSASLSALFYEEGPLLPTRIHSLPLGDARHTDAATLAAARTWLAGLRLPTASHPAGIWIGTGVEVLHGGGCRFTHRWLSFEGGKPASGPDFTPDWSDVTVWAADVRDAQHSAKAAAERRRSRFLWRALVAGTALAAALAVAQIGAWSIQAMNHLEMRRITELDGPVRRVQNKLALAGRITQSIEQDIQPYAMLAAINPLRPATVYYTKVVARSFEELQLEGESTVGVTPVNEFADAIGKLPFVRTVVNSSQTRSGRTSFEFTVLFNQIPADVAVADEPPAAAGSADLSAADNANLSADDQAADAPSTDGDIPPATESVPQLGDATP
jgi:hypothetical protein